MGHLHCYLFAAPDALVVDRFFSASAEGAKVQKEFISALSPPEAIEKIGQYFYKKTTEFVLAGSCPLIHSNTKSVNIVDVLKLVPIHWAASEIVRLLYRIPLTTFLITFFLRLVYR